MHTGPSFLMQGNSHHFSLLRFLGEEEADGRREEVAIGGEENYSNRVGTHWKGEQEHPALLDSATALRSGGGGIVSRRREGLSK
ncbi:hypothetical protein KP509_22G077300 [Ceratopteris richardii]|uniref:Uncharacterized protein n=1 Tax=Ceratopteris richardii TaxID=49495 RepID=A0A8T2S7N9_CERRI|nr:hypothetical protein KP509_22G077300 [Ceratopteris richardii]